ncbi:MAG: HlyD family type I secretion periplasmic adaptor subunit [Pseudomonadota bacterium]
MAAKRAWSAQKPMFLGMIAILLLFGGFGTWSLTTELAGAVIAPGQIQVERNRQAVQHPEGGVVAEILVDEGSFVEEDQVVLRLDGTAIESELAIMQVRIDEFRARRARLEAERDDAETIEFREDLLLRAGTDAVLAEVIQGQQNLFTARSETLAVEVEQLRRRSEQLAAQLNGFLSQRQALTEQRDIAEEELATQQDLLDRGLAGAAIVLRLRREVASVVGSLGELEAAIAQVDGQRTELDLAILQRVDQRRQDAITELREIVAAEDELDQQIRALSQRLERMEIRAPETGVVYGFTVLGRRSVAQPGEPMMYLVPQDRPLRITTRIEPIHIDQVFVGQEAVLRFSVFDQRTTPELFGSVVRVSADAFQEQTTGASFYEAEILLNDGEAERLGQNLLPGMPVETFIRTQDRTPFSYLVGPFVDYFNRAFRET